MITVLIVMAVLLLRVCIAAALSVCLRERDGSGGVFRPGTVQIPSREPGLRPEAKRMPTSNRQVLTDSLPAKDRIANDDVPVRVDAVLSFRLVDVGTAAVNEQGYQGYQGSVSRLARTCLHSRLGRAEWGDLSSSNENLRLELTEIVEAPSEQPTLVTPHKTARYAASGPGGPQDAPPWEPWDGTRGPQDAPGGPQDATVGLQDATGAETITTQVEEPVESLGALIHRNFELLAVMVRDAFGLSNPSPGSCSGTSITGKRVVVGWAVTLGVARSGGAAKVLRDFAVGRRMPSVVCGRVDASAVPGGELTQRAAAVERAIPGALPRPVAAPAFFGGREDAGYFRGWDDGVDEIGRGDQATGPSWGSAAYMTGWRDAVSASERARRG